MYRNPLYNDSTSFYKEVVDTLLPLVLNEIFNDNIDNFNISYGDSVDAIYINNTQYGGTGGSNIKYELKEIRQEQKQLRNYLITNNNSIIPCINSGIIYNIDIINDLSPFINDLLFTLNYCIDIYNLSNKSINILPTGIKYLKDNKNPFTV